MKILSVLHTVLLLSFFYIVCKMNITRVSKKRDLSDESDSGEQQKKVREGCLENLDIVAFLQIVWIHRYVCKYCLIVYETLRKTFLKQKQKKKRKL